MCPELEHINVTVTLPMITPPPLVALCQLRHLSTELGNEPNIWSTLSDLLTSVSAPRLEMLDLRLSQVAFSTLSFGTQPTSTLVFPAGRLDSVTNLTVKIMDMQGRSQNDYNAIVYLFCACINIQQVEWTNIELLKFLKALKRRGAERKLPSPQRLLLRCNMFYSPFGEPNAIDMAGSVGGIIKCLENIGSQPLQILIIEGKLGKDGPLFANSIGGRLLRESDSKRAVIQLG